MSWRGFPLRGNYLPSWIAQAVSDQEEAVIARVNKNKIISRKVCGPNTLLLSSDPSTYGRGRSVTPESDLPRHGLQPQGPDFKG